MPIAAISNADVPKTVSSSMLKRSREVVSTTISSMLRMCATGRPPVASRIALVTAAVTVWGSIRVRTIHHKGAMRELSSVILFGEIAPADDGHLEDVKITPRDWEVSCSTRIRIVAVRTPDNVERQPKATLQRQTARGGTGRDAGNGIDPLGAVVNDLRDA